MNLNTDVWGDSSTWRQEQYLPATEGAGYNILKASKPRIATFSSNNGTLAAGNTAGKTPINQSLDPTICPCGQDPAISPFAKIRFFKNHQSDDLNKVPDQTVMNDSPCNWFLYEGTGGSLYTNHTNETGAAWRWLPNATITDNMDGRIVPFTFWQTKSLLIYVTLYYVSSYNNGAANYTEMTLDEWAANPTRKVADIKLNFLGVDSAALSGISYKTGTAAQMSETRWGGVGYIGKVWSDTERYILNVYPRGVTLDVIGHLRGNSWASSPYFAMNNFDMFEGAELKAKYVPYQTEFGWSVWCEIPYSEANYNKVLSIAALFGCPFTASPTKRSFNVDFTDNELYLPIIDDNGIAHGEYTHGAANATNPFNSKDSVRDFDYNPTIPHDGNTYDNTTIFNVIGAGASLTKRYLLDGVNVRKLSTDLFTICDTISENQTVWDNFDSKVKSEFLTQSPIDSIVSLIRLPFTPTHGTTKQAVKLGRYTASAEGYTITNMIHTITFSGIDIFPKFGNSFLDYEPYTKYELYVPFCGTIQLNAADVIDKTLNCRIVVDLLTGACTAYVMANSLCIETITGNVGAQLPITGLDTATINANIQSAEQNQKAAKWKYFASYLPIPSVQKNNLSDIIKNGDTTKRNLEQTHYELTHINTPMHTIGSASPVTGWASDLVLRLLIYYPVGSVIDSTGDTPSFNTAALTEFGNLNGFATCETGQLKNYHGFTTVSDADLKGIIATDSELLEIRNLLQSGVYL